MFSRVAALSVKHRYYVASLALHDASIAEITAQLLSLSYVYLISSDDGSIIRIFVQINILEGRAGYVLMGHVQSLFHIHSVVWQQKQSNISINENLAASKYSMWLQRGKNVYE